MTCFHCFRNKCIAPKCGVNLPDKERPVDEGATVDYQEGLELALTYINAPSVDPGYESLKWPALTSLNKWLKQNGIEEVE